LTRLKQRTKKPMNDFGHSRPQENALHKLLRMCAVLYLEGQGIGEPDLDNKRRLAVYKKAVNTQMEALKTLVKFIAYTEDKTRFKDILLANKGSSKLQWHDYATLIDIIYKHFPSVLGIDPPLIGKDKGDIN